MSEIKNRATLDSTQFQAGLKNMQGGVKNLGASLKGIPGIGAALSVAGLAKIATDAMRSADEIDNLSIQMGLGVETVQAYNVALKESGLSMGDLQSALDRIKRAQAEAISGNQKSAQSFAALGISMDRLRQMGTEDLLESVGRGMGENEGAASATQAAYDLLGRSAGRLTDVLIQMNRNGIQAQIQAYKELGLVIDEVTNERLNQAELRMNRFSTRSKNFAMQTLSDFGQGMMMIGHMNTGSSIDEAFQKSNQPTVDAMNARREGQAKKLQAQIDEAEMGAGEQLETLQEKMRLEALSGAALKEELNIKLRIAQADLAAAENNIQKFAALQKVYDIEQQISRIKDEAVKADEIEKDTPSGAASFFRSHGGGGGNILGSPAETRREKHFADMARALQAVDRATREQTEILRTISNQDGNAIL